MNIDAAWETKIVDLWKAFDTQQPEIFRANLELLLAALPDGSAIAHFERAGLQDSTGNPELAVPLYEAALKGGLTGLRRRRAVIQMASSIRNLGNAQRSFELLSAELGAATDELDGAVRAFLALALTDLGREREAVSISLEALAQYLPRYNRSLVAYARNLNNK